MESWDTDSEFLATFRAEAEERLQCLDDGLIKLENNPDDQDLIKRLFRDAHTLKGSAGMMGFSDIKDLSHKIEDVLSSIQSGQVKVSRELVDTLLTGLDKIKTLLPQEAAIVQGEAAGATKNPQSFKADSGKLTTVSPNVTGIDAISQAKAEAVADLGAQVHQAPPQQKKAAARSANDATIRVNIDRLDQLLNLMGEVMVYQNDNEARMAGLGDLREKSQELQEFIQQLAVQVEQLKAGNNEASISALSQKLAQAGSNAEALLSKVEITTAGLELNCASRKLVLDELQERALSVRMLPVGSIFKTFPRLVRDLAAVTGKKVKLQIAGEECELDKRILEQVADPLMHILRNAVHHGIEDPAVRVRAGKPEEGNIRLSATHRGDRVAITIADDGGGINIERVRTQAIEKDMISAQEEITPTMAFDLICRPGFSTAESVSDISGRGVGLDVVRHNIEMLEGTVEISSAPGEGTTFTVLLPVTLAVIKSLMIESNHNCFALPLSYVMEMMAIDDSDIQTLGGQQGFLMRGMAVPLIDLQEFIGGGPTVSEGIKNSVVIVGNDRFRVGLKVGKLLSEQEIVIKSIGGFLPRLPFVAGVCILGSGETAVVINVNEILKRAREGVRSANSITEIQVEKKPEQTRPSLLVVEDSLVVRELQKNILESAGYEVATAVDGQDALDYLSRKTFDCVITDLEMPRMSGIDLTTAMRHSENLKETPVVIVTSLASEEDRRLGLDAGANAYMMKGAYDQKQLLATIERLVA